MLRYTLTENGQVLRSGEAKISDMNYLHRINRHWDSESLRYEKRMLDEWFADDILRKRPG